jgi:pilus assembly protein Flp/PilA
MLTLFVFLNVLAQRSSRGDRGATAVEYALIVGLVAMVIVGSVTVFGMAVSGLFTSVPPGL